LSALRWKIAQFFEQFWWKRYLRNKPKQQYLQWKQAYWQQFIQPVNKYIPELFSEEKLQVLDAGCGPAGIFMILQQHHVTAIDPLLHEYERLPHFSKSNYAEVNFVPVALEDFIAEKMFDVVFCLNAINHVNNIQLSVNNLYNIIKPGGYMVLSVDAHRNSFLKRIFQFVPGDILHPHQFSLNDYMQLLPEEQWTITHTETIKRESIFDYVLIVARKK
jgi:2-polyprenyl-6-hydroxyphenyl methylase/3-demethylubiquinone-9 3-methyltransferase